MSLMRLILDTMRPLHTPRPVSDYELARVVEEMDHVRRERRNTMMQRDTADGLMFLAEGALRDRHDGDWPACL